MNNEKSMQIGSKELESFIDNYRNSSLHSSEIFHGWKNTVGDFTEDTKPFWAWATLRDAETINEVVIGTMATSYYMFKQVGLFLTQNAFRTVGKTTASFKEGKFVVDANMYAFAIAGLTFLDLITESEGGVSTPLTGQINPLGSFVDPAMAIIKGVGSIYTGKNMTEAEYTSTKYAVTRGLGGMPFGGTAQQLWDGYEDSHSALDAAKNVIKDVYDPIFMIRTFMEQVHTNAEDLKLIPELKAEYKKNGIPILQQMTAQNKTWDRIIDMVGIASKSYSSKFSDMTDSERNKLNYSASQDWAKLMLGLFNAMPYVNKSVDEAAYSLKDILTMRKGDGDTDMEFKKMLGDLLP
jgi:hypothetical protein